MADELVGLVILNMTDNMNYWINESEIILEESKLKFEYPIAEVLEISTMLIIRLKTFENVIFNENVFGVSLVEKKIKWQIDKRKYNLPSCPYMHIMLIENQLRVFNWCSYYLDVNPVTGEVIRQGDSK